MTQSAGTLSPSYNLTTSPTTSFQIQITSDWLPRITIQVSVFETCFSNFKNYLSVYQTCKHVRKLNAKIATKILTPCFHPFRRL